MDFVEYQKIKRRMTKSDNLGVCATPCRKCPLSIENSHICLSCMKLEMVYPEKAVEIVEKWAKEHPVKTRQSEFLKMFPNTRTEDYNEKNLFAFAR